MKKYIVLWSLKKCRDHESGNMSQLLDDANAERVAKRDTAFNKAVQSERDGSRRIAYRRMYA